MPDAIPSKTRAILTDEIATVANDIDLFSGWLGRMENPDPILLAQGNGKGLKLYDEVARDAHASSVLETRYLTVVGNEYEVVPADDSPKAQEVADFVKKSLDGFPFTTACKELLQGILYGFYVSEVIWAVRDGRVVPARMIGKHPRRFVFTLKRELRLLTLQNMIEGEPLPERKFVVFTWGDSDNPYGCGIGQKIWWPVWFKKNGVKFWLVFLEKFGMPTVVGKYPPGTEKTQQQALLDAIDAIQTDTGIKIPDTMVVELLEATRAGNAGYEDLCDYMDRQISKAVAGQTLTTEVKEGSFAAAKVHEEVRQEIVAADADMLCDCLNRSLIRWIVDLNFGPQAEYPTVWFRVEQEKDLKPLADRDKILADLVDIPASYFYETYGLPEPAPQDTIARSKPALQAPSAPSFAESAPGGLFPDQAAIDQVTDPDRRVLNTMLAPVVQKIKNGTSYEEILDDLMNLYPAMKQADAERLIERAIFVAELWGRLNA